jgi:hypothetical protein
MDDGDDDRVQRSDSATSCKNSLSDASMCGVLPFSEKRDIICFEKILLYSRVIITFEASLVISGG